MSRAKTPELLNICEQQLEDISLRIDTNSLSAEDIKLLRTLLTTYTWLMKQLSRSKITIHRLKQLFGYSSEKKNRLKNSNPDVPPESGAREQSVSTVPSLRAMESRRRGRVVPGSLRAGCFSAGKI